MRWSESTDAWSVRSRLRCCESMGRMAGTRTDLVPRVSHGHATVIIALGSNLGDRAVQIRRAIAALPVRVVRVSRLFETEPVDAPAGSPQFLNAVAVGHTSMSPLELLAALHLLERRLGRTRNGRRNEPRTIDLDLILHGATRMRSSALTLPHPRASRREFVMAPLRTVWTGEVPAMLRLA